MGRRPVRTYQTAVYFILYCSLKLQNDNNYWCRDSMGRRPVSIYQTAVCFIVYCSLQSQNGDNYWVQGFNGRKTGKLIGSWFNTTEV
jgi:hypothetical protein